MSNKMSNIWQSFISNLDPRQPASGNGEKRPRYVGNAKGVVCPECGQRCATQATVTKWLDPPEWGFYGKQGERAIKCQGSHFVHFWVTVDGGKQNRIAWTEERHNWKW